MKRRLAPVFVATLLVLCLLLSGCAGNNALSDNPAPPQSGNDAPATPEAAAPPQPETASEPSEPSAHSTENEAAEEAYIDPEFTLRYAEDLSEEYEGFVEYTADETDMGIDIVIAPDSPAKSFRFLKLEYLSSDDSGNIEFDVEELFSVDELLPEKPFMVRMTMFGTIPGYGFSYLGADGLEKRFAISESGFDGSIILIEFN